MLYEMGVVLSSMETLTKSQANRPNAMTTEGKSLVDYNSDLNLKCENETLLSRNLLPGQAEEISGVARELPQSCVYLDYGSDTTLRLPSTPTEDNDIITLAEDSDIITPTDDTDIIKRITFSPANRSESINRNVCSLESLLDSQKKRFPALSVREKPKKVKQAMLESLLVVVPSLKYISLGKEKRSKSKACKNKVRVLHTLTMENEESPGKFIYDSVCSFESSQHSMSEGELGLEQCYDSFSTAYLSEKGMVVAEKQKIL